MAKLLYMDDSYQREFEGNVVKVDGKNVWLDKTAFYPNSGGQPNDEGTLEKDGETFKVKDVKKQDGDVVHVVDKDGLKEGDTVWGKIDWERRYKLMRMHTSAHVVSGLLNKEMGAMITGNQLNLEKTRIDFSVENYDPETLKGFIVKANELIEKDLGIKIYSISREEADKDPSLFKLAKGFPPEMKVLRIVEIEGFDKQADGGTHVKSLKEIGKIEFLKAENKGKTNRRMYYKIETEA